MEKYSNVVVGGCMITNKDLNEQYSLFAQNVKKYRCSQHMTQEVLAEQSDISISYVKRIESGNEYINISLTVMLKISKALNVSIHSLFAETKKPH